MFSFKEENFIFEFQVKYNPELIELFKSFKGRWQPDKKVWHIPCEEISHSPLKTQKFLDNIEKFLSPEDYVALSSKLKKFVGYKGFAYPKDGVLYVRFLYNEEVSRKLVNELFGEWDKKLYLYKINLIPSKLEQILSFLDDHSICIIPGRTMLEEEVKKISKNIKDSYAKEGGNLEIRNLKKPLYPFQKCGVAFLNKNGGRGIIGDEMGLGKTVQALGYIAHNDIQKVLIISPAGLMYNWYEEIKNFVKGDTSTLILNKKTLEVIRVALLKKEEIPRFIIVSYSYINKVIDVLMQIKFEAIIVDEAHYLKSHKTQRSKILLPFLKNFSRVIFLTGTPLLNRPIEIFNMLHVLDPKTFSNRHLFGIKFCNAVQTSFGWNYNGASNIDVLAQILRGKFMIRREKKDVLSELPEKTRTIVKIDAVSKETDEIIENIRKVVVDTKKGVVDKLEGQKTLIKYMDLYKRVSYENKKEYVFEFLDAALEENKNMVIFCYHNDVLEELVNKYKSSCIYISSAMLNKERQEKVREYNMGDKPFFITTLGIGAEGFNLQKANTVVFVQFDWVPGKLLQAEDRVHRINQKNAVNVYYFALNRSIDVNFLSKIFEKSKIQDDVLLNIYETFVIDNVCEKKI